MPNILIEAMSAGLPIASSYYGPMPEILGAKGLFFDPMDVDSIADTLRFLINNPKVRMRLAENASLRAQDYSWTRTAKDTFDFIALVLKSIKLNTNG